MGAGRMFPARDLDGNYIQVYRLYPQVRDLQQRMGCVKASPRSSRQKEHVTLHSFWRALRISHML
jgi:hypothetical protein